MPENLSAVSEAEAILATINAQQAMPGADHTIPPLVKRLAQLGYVAEPVHGPAGPAGFKLLPLQAPLPADALAALDELARAGGLPAERLRGLLLAEIDWCNRERELLNITSLGRAVLKADAPSKQSVERVRWWWRIVEHAAGTVLSDTASENALTLRDTETALRRLLLALPAEPDVAATADEKPAPAGKLVGQGMPLRTAQKKAEAYCRHHLFPGVNALAAKIGCSSSTMRHAITESVILQRKQAEAQLRGKTTIPAVALSGAVAGAIAQTREPAPADAVSEAIDSPFRRLLEQATPDERATLNAMTPDEQRELVAMLQDDPDAAPKNAQDRRAGAPGRGAKTLQK